jgi:hypothetical protein
MAEEPQVQDESFSGTDPDTVDEGFQTGTEGQFQGPAGGTD